jgi:phosphoglycolate phosphatase-like HAD superfamily hydrolase
MKTISETCGLFGAEQDSGHTIVLDRDLRLYGYERQTISVRSNSSGGLMDLTIFDFDLTIMDTAYSFWAASNRLVEIYTDNLSLVPKLSQFERGTHLDFHAWGVSKKAPIDQVWDIFAEIILGIESAKPSRLFPGVAECLQKRVGESHLVILTFNAVHPIAEMVMEQAGVHVDVIVVEDDKTEVLRVLAEHHSNHGIRSKLFFFDDSPGGILAAGNCGHPLFPIAVARNEMLLPRNDVYRATWRQQVVKSGAYGIVTPGRMYDAISGVYDLDASLCDWGKATAESQI